MPFRANVYSYDLKRIHGLLLAVPVRCLRYSDSLETAVSAVLLFNNRRWPRESEFSWLVEPGGEFAAVEEVDR